MKKLLTHLIAIAIFFICFVNHAIADDPISLELAKKVALYYGAERWGAVSIYDHKLFVDPIDEKPKVYVFTLYLGDENPPRIEQT